MASDAPISFAFAGLPAGYCFTTPQRFALDIAAGLSGYLPGQFTTIIDSDSEPAVADRDKLWHKTIAGAPSGHIFKFFDGVWMARNLSEPAGDERRIFIGTENDIWSYDGGNGDNPTVTPPTDATGAMWEKDAVFDFRMPLGAGTSPAGTIVLSGGTGGEETHLLTVAEIPAHQHSEFCADSSADAIGGAGANRRTFGLASTTDGIDSNISTSSVGGGTAHNNMPPFVGVFFIKRTARIFYTA